MDSRLKVSRSRPRPRVSYLIGV